MLVDTSVWVAHFRVGNARLGRLLEEGHVACHPFVIGELACGTLRDRATVLGLLQRLPEVPVASHAEAMSLVERHRLAGSGLGWRDVHLLASTLLGHARLWSLDRPLRDAAVGLSCGAPAE
jgi:predicted nucleic acid-binding protein